MARPKKPATRTALDEYLEEQFALTLPDGTIKAITRLFCRRQGDGEFQGQPIRRTMIVGAAVDGEIMQPGASEDQLILGTIYIVPRQIYTASESEKSPGRGMRADQILTRPECVEPKYWDKRLK